MRILLSAFIFVASCLLFVADLDAQTLLQGTEAVAEEDAAVELPDVLTREGARELLSTLSDAEVRQLLLDRLDAVAAEQEGEAAEGAGGLSELFNLATVGVVNSVSEAVRRLPQLGNTIERAFGVFLAQLGPGGLPFMIITMSIALSGALAVELVFRRMIRDWVTRIDMDQTNPNLRQTLSFLSKRLTADFVAVFIFFLAAGVIGNLAGRLIGQAMLESHAQADVIVRYMEPIWGNLVVLPRIAGAIGRFFLAPRRPAFRIVTVDEQTARGLYLHQIGLALLLGLTFWAPGFLVMTGETFGSSRLGFWLNLAVHLYVIWAVWRYRPGMTMMMRGPGSDVSEGQAWASRAYPWFVILATVLTWWIVEILAGYGRFDLLQKYPHIWMIILISFAPAMDTVIRGLVRHLMPPMAGEGPLAERAYTSLRSSYVRIGRVIVFVLVVLAIARIWQIDLSNLAAAGVGVQLAGRLIEFMMILAVGYLIYEITSLYINRKLAAEITASGYDPDNADFGGDGGGAGGSRLSTVLPLILFVTRVAIIVVFVLLALGNVGIDTTPLLAGAGIVGLAIGFGAQKLVTDVVSGIFFLVDDAFRSGEYVEIDGTMGTVEKISLRSLQLRHHKGPVHTIPYGEIPKITNFSRDWVIMKLRFTVPFDTDPNKVKKIFKKIGAEMLEHPDLGQDFLQPFKSQGVLEIDDVGMVIRGKFMAKPGKQFMIRKEVFNRVSAAFGEAGIDFARREVRVAIPGLDSKDELTEEDKAAIAAAASQAAQEQMAEDVPSKDDR
ncbi:MAG: mechanosensitive ion channel domain-containing protein [Pseudomonadota bacterium]